LPVPIFILTKNSPRKNYLTVENESEKYSFYWFRRRKK
jgi:hypothetical protein